MKKFIWLIVILIFSLVMEKASASLINASIVNAANGQIFSPFYGPSADAYIDSDNEVGNPDFALKVCADSSSELTGKYATAAYKIGNTSDFVDVAWDSTYGSMTLFNSCDSKCCTTYSRFGFRDTMAVYPAEIFVGVSSDSVLDNSDTFIYVPPSNGWLRGYYTTNNVQSTYNQNSGNVSLDISAVTGYKSASETEPIYPGGAAKDVNYIIVGICSINSSNIVHYECTSSRVVKPSDPAVSLYTGVVNPSNSNPAIIRYYVINGIGTSFCIGPDISVSLVPSNPYPYSGEIINFTATISNINNVDISIPFNVSFYYENGNLIDKQLVSSLSKGSSTTRNITLNTAIFGSSGSHSVIVKVDQEGAIGECNELNNNATASISIEPIYFINVWIDGEATNEFPRAGIPYNITIYVNNSDGNYIPNATIHLVEHNGLSMFAPLQIWNHSNMKRGMISESIGEVKTNGTGWVNFTLIPTGNKPLVEQEPELADYVGNYSLYAELYINGVRQYVHNGTARSTNLPFKVLNHTTIEASYIKVVNHQNLVETIINAIYQSYASILDWLS